MSNKTVEFEQMLPSSGGYRIMVSTDMEEEEMIRFIRAVYVGCISTMPLVSEASQAEYFDSMMRRLLRGEDKGYE